MAVHESLRLHITSDSFFIEPYNDSGTHELLVIDRLTQEITLSTNHGQIPSSAVTRTIYGIMGIIRLLAGPYLIVITGKTKVGDVDGHTIWRVTSTELHSYQRTLLHLNEQQISDNKTYVSMVELALKSTGLYFSTTYDLTHTLQRLQNTSPDFLSLAMHERVRFVWNGHVLRELAQQSELARYCLPVIMGFVHIHTNMINNKQFDYALISRRSVYRAGTRFYVRGLDTEGYCANFVETEQLVLFDGHKCSFVQTRGSIPLFWSQRPCLKYMPQPVISNTMGHTEAFKRHFENQIYNYGKQVIVSLINHKGREHLLEKALTQMIINAQNNSIRYESFDFHHECRKMRWDRLSLLMDRLENDINNFGYFMVQRDGTVMSHQAGIMRTSCMDCLDRTNVVQGLIARVVLETQLQRLGILHPGQKLVEQEMFMTVYRDVWADHADALSIQYAGTGALKTDFTRTGKRTKIGMLMDGVNSLTRYFKNNFSDGFRQDSIDLFLGNYTVGDGDGISHMSPFRKDKDWKYYALPVIFLVAFMMCVISVLLPDEHLSEQAMYVLFWGVASVVSVFLIFVYGVEFVDQPRLTQAQSKTE
ncbi:phosphatidylinositol-3-phosphatase SAC1-like [Liolophura sinensis]|uniref:phosphatidylinositol-3-phosphatase SAC1-like n=1 Tax=Liolophura sinensis TaxID=3198878 RepID=UPI0031582187